MILEASHLVVITTVVSTGISTTHTLNSTYTVSGTGDPSGYITFNTAPASGVRITLKRVVPLYQRTRYVENDIFPAASHEAALDKLTMIAQQLDEKVGRAMLLEEGSPTIPVTFPEPGASKFIRYNSTGTALEAADITGTLNTTVDAVQATTYVGLPTPAAAGKLRWVTDEVRGLYADTGSRWVHAFARVAFVDAFGAVGDGTTDDRAAVLAAYNGLPASGGVLEFGDGTYDISSTLSFSKPIMIRGKGVDVTIIEISVNSNLNHLIATTGSIVVKDCTLRVKTTLTSNYSMNAVRQDLDGTGLSGRIFHFENVKLRGFNIGLYSDADVAHGVHASVRNCDIQNGGPNSAYIGSMIYLNRVGVGEITNCLLDQNNTGEHAIYCYGPTVIRIQNCTIKNASKSEVQAIKLVGDGLVVGANEIYKTWSVQNVDIENCFHGILFSTFQAQTLHVAEVSNVTVKSLTGSTNILGGILTVSQTDTARILNVRVSGASAEGLPFQGIHFTGGTNCLIEHATISDLYVKGWSTSSSGTYTLIGTNYSGANKPIKHLTLRDITADGNSTGRTIWNVNAFGGYGTEDILRLKEINLVEKNITENTSRPASLPADDATPSVAFGNLFKEAYTAATNVTQFDDMVKGEEYTISFTTGNLTLKDGTNLQLAGGSDKTFNANDTFTFYTLDGTIAIEKCRSEN